MSKHALKRIRLELGRTQEFPTGSSAHGYEFVAPLNEDGELAADAWKDVKSKCTVTRFWANEPEKHGFLRHVGKGWHFDYVAHFRDDNEPLFKLEQHHLIPDNYISVTEADGVRRPFRVVLVTPEAG